MKKHLTDETKLKIRLAKLGKKHSPETIKKIVEGNIGKKMSEEAIIKIKEARKRQDIKFGHTPHWKGGISMQYRAKNAPRPKPEFCEVCGRGGTIMYDHDHKTNQFRGWLCRYCNSSLGFTGDNIEILQNLIDYLKKNRSFGALP